MARFNRLFFNSLLAVGDAFASTQGCRRQGKRSIARTGETPAKVEGAVEQDIKVAEDRRALVGRCLQRQTHAAGDLPAGNGGYLRYRRHDVRRIGYRQHPGMRLEQLLQMRKNATGALVRFGRRRNAAADHGAYLNAKGVEQVGMSMQRRVMVETCARNANAALTAIFEFRQLPFYECPAVRAYFPWF